MDRIIEVKVKGSYLSKDSSVAGVQHEANAKVLRIEFDEGWDGYAKTVTFWDALGGNPVNRILTADLLEDMVANARIYLLPIPGEAMTEAGEMKFVIDGWNGPMFAGNRPCLTASFKIETVDASTLCLADYLLPEEHEELVGRKVVVDGESYTIAAAGYSGDSEHTILILDRTFAHPEEGTKLFQPGGKRQRSEECRMKVKEGDIDLEAGESMDPTPTQAEQLQKQVDNLLGSVIEQTDLAEKAADMAGASAESAKTSEENAARSAKNALDSENYADGYMQDAKLAAEEAARAVAEAKTNYNALMAKSYAVGDTGMRPEENTDNARYYLEQADAAAKAAEQYKNEAKQIAGVEFATEAYVDNAVATSDIDCGAF